MAIRSSDREKIDDAVPLRRYPQDVFYSDYSPVLSLVSLGRYNAIMVFNSIVLGGWGPLGLILAAIKKLIEVSTIGEIRGYTWGNARAVCCISVWRRLGTFLTYHFCSCISNCIAIVFWKVCNGIFSRAHGFMTWFSKK